MANMPSSFSSRGPSTSLFRSRTMSSRGPEPSITGQGGQLNGCSVAASAMDKLKVGHNGTAPSWWTVRPGLCIEGTCETPTCQAYRKKVIYKAGFTSLDLMSSTACKCPSCQHSIKPTTAGFYKCEWKFSGTKQDHPNAAPEAVDMEEWQQAGDDYERFKEDSKDETVWTKLVITTRALPSTKPSTEPKAEPSTEPSTKPESASKKRARQPSDSADPNMVECSICCGDPLSRFGPTAINTPCGHCFHRACLKPWVLDQHKGCPTCRRDVSCLVKELQK